MAESQNSDDYLWLDAKHLKVRDRGPVRSKALVIVSTRG